MAIFPKYGGLGFLKLTNCVFLALKNKQFLNVPRGTGVILIQLQLTRIPNSSLLLATALSKMVGQRYSRGINGMKNYIFETPHKECVLNSKESNLNAKLDPVG